MKSAAPGKNLKEKSGMGNTKIGMVLMPDCSSGGATYERIVKEALDEQYNVQPIYLKKNKICPSQQVNFLLNRRAISLNYDALILNINAAFGMDYRHYKGIPKFLIWHHYDPWEMVRGRLVSGKYMQWLHERILRHAAEFDVLVVVGEFWRSFFAKYDFKRIEVIYNSFDLDLFASLSSRQNHDSARQQIGLPSGKSMVYIGQPQKAKGADRIFSALKKRDDLFLIGSGRKHIDLPIHHFSGNYEDYLKMLGLSDVALSMSRMYEGWNRTAHEAMLMGTPVIGNAIGNSGELLIGAEQVICHDYNQLGQAIDVVLSRQTYFKQKAYSYVTLPKFSKEFFVNRWQSLVADVLGREKRINKITW